MRSIKLYATYVWGVMVEPTADRIAEASRELTVFIDELREAHGDPVYESEDMTIFADRHNLELDDIAREIDGVTRAEVSEWHHETARERYGRAESNGVGDPWATADPVVVLHD